MSSKKSSSKTHYVNNKQLLEEMTKYRNSVIEAKKNDTEKPRVSNYIGQCIMLIAQRMSFKYNFSNYSFKEEMISDAIENCMMYIDNFDPEKSSNPFAYFSQIIHFAFVRRIQKEQKQQYIKIKNMQNSFVFSELQDSINHDVDSNGMVSNFFDNDITSEFVRSFEKNLEKKKAISQQKQGVEKFMDSVDNPVIV